MASTFIASATTVPVSPVLVNIIDQMSDLLNRVKNLEQELQDAYVMVADRDEQIKDLTHENVTLRSAARSTASSASVATHVAVPAPVAIPTMTTTATRAAVTTSPFGGTATPAPLVASMSTGTSSESFLGGKTTPASAVAFVPTTSSASVPTPVVASPSTTTASTDVVASPPRSLSESSDSKTQPWKTPTNQAALKTYIENIESKKSCNKSTFIHELSLMGVEQRIANKNVTTLLAWRSLGWDEVRKRMSESLITATILS